MKSIFIKSENNCKKELVFSCMYRDWLQELEEGMQGLALRYKFCGIPFLLVGDIFVVLFI